jgi:hypothetical protein
MSAQDINNEVQKKTPFEDTARRKELWSKISECIDRYEKKEKVS